MKPLREIPPALEILNQIIYLALGVAERDGQLGRVHIQKTAHNLHLCLGFHFIIVLGDLGNRQLLFHHLHGHRILLEPSGNVLDL